MPASRCWLGTKHIAYDTKTPSMAVDVTISDMRFKTTRAKSITLDATESYPWFKIEYAERDTVYRQVLM